MTSPSKLGPYIISGVLGRGATGTVYEATDPSTGQNVAVKLLHAHHAEDPAVRGAFGREVELAKELHHPGFARVLATGDQDGSPWIAFELVRGSTLQEVARRGPMPWQQALPLFVHVADVVAALHSRRIVHRDIKPANIVILADGRVKLLDFGIAAHVASDATRTSTGGGAGTPRYMSPEQVLGQRVGPPSDIYALGICLFEIIAGTSPFRAGGEAAMRAAHVSVWPAALSDLADVPAALDAIVGVCLSKEPSSRYEDARDFMEDLRTIGAHPDIAPGQTVAGRKLGLRRSARRLYGRSREMNVIRRWLAKHLEGRLASRLLVIRGCPGSGRSSLMEWAAREAHRLATARGTGAFTVRLVDDPSAELDRSLISPCIACRAPSFAPEDATTRVVDLPPLGRGALQHWVSEAVGVRPVSRREVDFLVHASGGWPGKVEPLLFRWSDRLRRGEPIGPESIGALVEATRVERVRTSALLDRLHAEARLALQLASWIHPCTVSLLRLAREAGLPPEREPMLVGELLGTRLGVSVDGESLAFRDTVLPRVIQDATPPELVPLLAQAAAAMLNDQSTGTALRRRSDLLWAAEQRTDGISLSRAAASTLLSENLPAEGCATVTEWMDRWGSPLNQDDLDVVGLAVRTLTELGDLTGALGLLDRAIPRAEDPHSLQLERGRVLWKQEHLDDALALFLRVSRAARRTAEHRTRFRAVASAASLLHGRGRSRRAAALLGALEGLADQVPEDMRCRWLVNRVGLAAEMGDEATAVACRNRAQLLAERLGLESSLQTIAQASAVLLMRRGELDDAVALLERTIETAKHARNLESLAWTQPLLATAHLQAGRVPDAEKTLRKALRASFHAHDAATAGSIYELMARVEAWRGHAAKARRLISLSRRHSPEDRQYERYRRLAEADVALIEGNLEEASAHFAAAGALSGSADEEGALLSEVVGRLIDVARCRAAGTPAPDGLKLLRPRLARSSFAFRVKELERRCRMT